MIPVVHMRNLLLLPLSIIRQRTKEGIHLGFRRGNGADGLPKQLYSMHFCSFLKNLELMTNACSMQSVIEQTTTMSIMDLEITLQLCVDRVNVIHAHPSQE